MNIVQRIMAWFNDLSLGQNDNNDATGGAKAGGEELFKQNIFVPVDKPEHKQPSDLNQGAAQAPGADGLPMPESGVERGASVDLDASFGHAAAPAVARSSGADSSPAEQATEPPVVVTDNPAGPQIAGQDVPTLDAGAGAGAGAGAPVAAGLASNGSNAGPVSPPKPIGRLTDTDQTANVVAEDAAPGTVVGITASAIDPDDTVTYALTGNPDGLFAIDSHTGVITVAGQLDHESMSDVTLEVTATSADGSTSVETFTVAISDVDEHDIATAPGAEIRFDQVDELASVGTEVGVAAFAEDADGTDTVTYALTADANGAFTIDAETGLVTIADPSVLDFEQAETVTIEVTATSTDGSQSVLQFDVTLNDSNEFNVSAVEDTDVGANSVLEGAAIGGTVGIAAFAADQDGSNSDVTYALTDDAGGTFTIDEQTGVVTIADNTALDFETHQQLQIEVQATSADGSQSSQLFTVAVTDSNEFDVAPIVDTDAAPASVDENAAVGALVGITAFASDADGSTNAITYSLSDDANGAFTIDPQSGQVTVADPVGLDFESQAQLQIEVTATSADGSRQSRAFTVQLNDVNEMQVSPLLDGDTTANAVSEAAAAGTSVGVVAFAEDGDVTQSDVVYSLLLDADGAFQINAETGEVTVLDPGQIDFEAASTLQVQVMARSADGSTSVEDFVIDVLDNNEFSLSSLRDQDTSDNTVTEGTAAGTEVGLVAFAQDADGSNNAVSYELTDSAGGAFAIDADTGVVTVADPAAVDFESATAMTVEVQATSADGSSQTQTFNIAITDQNEFALSSLEDSDSRANQIGEDAAAGDEVGLVVQAVDEDGTNNQVHYELLDNAQGAFSIDAETGVVRVADPSQIDFESATTLEVEVQATSADGSQTTAVYAIAINDANEFSISAIADADADNNQVSEAAVTGTAVGVTAAAFDADGSDNIVTYSLTDDAGGAFYIDPETGLVRVADPAAIDFETSDNLQIEVAATSADGSTATAVFQVGVTDSNEFAVSPVTDADQLNNAVQENAPAGTPVGITASAFDADGSANTVAYQLLDDANGAFAINPETGEVTVADPTALDFESAQTMQVEVQATFADGSTTSAVFNIAVSDDDEFDLSPLVDGDDVGNLVSEGANVGDLVGITAAAFDADGSQDDVTYSLINDADGAFAIDPVTGQVSVADPGVIDYENSPSLQIEVRAESADGSSSTAVFNVAVDDVNEFSVSPLQDSDHVTNTVSEGAAIGDLVGVTAQAFDPDGSNNSVSYALLDDAGGAFRIDPQSGEISVADPGAIDFETAQTMQVEVQASAADGSTSSATFTIGVNDVDEFDITPLVDGDAAVNAISESAAAGTSVGVTASAFDADASDSGVTYVLLDDAGGAFQIDEETGEITVSDSAAVDFETASTLQVHVQAASADGSTSTAWFAIAIEDENEFSLSAIVDSDGAVDAVAENAAAGDFVGLTAAAFDADGSNNQVAYSLVDDADGAFQIDVQTGQVSVADPAALDFETADSLQIEVQAVSADGSVSNATFDIAINDVDEFQISPLQDADAAGNTVSEDAAAGTPVGLTASAFDADGSNNEVTYTLLDDAGGAFEIDPTSGEVAIANPNAIDFETQATMQVQVQAASADGSVSNATFDIAVTDVNEFDISPVTDADSTSNAISEVASAGDSVGLVAHAFDADGGDNTVSYALRDDANGAFAIDPASGEVVVADPLAIDFENSASLHIEVQATSADGSSSTATFNIAVNDADEFDVSPVSDSNAATNTVSEAAAVGTTVGLTATAFDADGSNDVVTYTLLNDADGAFQINSATGEVTVADPAAIDFEAATTLQLEVLAESQDGSTNTALFNVAVSDVDEFSISPVTDVDAVSNAIDEDATVGDLVGLTASAFDADGSNNGVSYTLLDDAGGAFQIDSTTGEVSVADPSAINFEAADILQVEVQAESEDGSTSTVTFSITVNDVNEFDITPVSDADAADNVVAENSAAGTYTGLTAAASDADGSNNAVSFSLTDDADGRFQIDADTGRVEVADPAGLNYEDASEHTIEVLATSADGSSSVRQFTIQVGDSNEFALSAASDSDAQANSVAENATAGTVVGLTAHALDADGSNNAVTYNLTDDANGAFVIDADSGVVTVLDPAQLDFETATSMQVEVTATSADGSSSSASFSIAITDVLDESPLDLTLTSTEQVINGSFEDVFVPNNSWVHTDDVTGWESNDDIEVWDAGLLGSVASDGERLVELDYHGSSVSAIWQDIQTQEDEVYSLSFDAKTRSANGNTDTIEVYWNGELVETVTPDTDQWQTISLEVVGTGGADRLEFREVASENDALGAHIDNISLRYDSDEMIVPESLASGSLVGTLSAIDPDAGDTHSYAIVDNDGNPVAHPLFEISGDELILRADQNLDFESAQSHTFNIQVTDSTGLTHTEAVTVRVTDINEHSVSAITDSDAAVNTVTENSAVGDSVGIVAAAFDADGSNSEVTYSLSNNPGNAFNIDAETGEVSVADPSALDYESATSMTVQVTATSQDGSASAADFVIAVDDANEFSISLQSDGDAAVERVQENSSIGTLVGIAAFAEDQDGSDSVSYSILNNTGGAFAIDAETGVVTVADPLQLDFESAQSMSITVRAESSDGSVSDVVYNIAITDESEFSVSAVSDSDAAANSVLENAQVGTTVGVVAAATDADGSNNVVTYSLSDDANGAFAIDAQSGLVTVADPDALNHDVSDTATIEVTATSADGSASTQAFNIAVNSSKAPTDISTSGVTTISAFGDNIMEIYVNGELVLSDGNWNNIDQAVTDILQPGDVIAVHVRDTGGPGGFAADFTTPNGENIVSNGDWKVVTQEIAGWKDQGFDDSAWDAATAHPVTDGGWRRVLDNSELMTESGAEVIWAGNVHSNNEVWMRYEVPQDFAGGSSNDLTVVENIPGGLVVATFSATDVDSQTLSYALVDAQGDAVQHDTFEIIGNQLVVKSGADIDAESTASYAIDVQVTDPEGNSYVETFNVTVSDVNEFTLTAQVDTDSAANEISEHALVGDAVGITAFSDDADMSDAIAYSLTQNPSGAFAIDADTGEVTVADPAAIDYESSPTLTFEVTAISSDGGVATRSYTVNVLDVGEPPTVSAADVQMDEDAGSVALDLGAVNTNLSVSLSGLPHDFLLSDGNQTITGDGQPIDLTDWDLDAITLHPPADFNGDITLTLTGSGDLHGSSTQVSSDFAVSVAATADVHAAGADVVAQNGIWTELDIQAVAHGPADEQIETVTLSGLPAGTQLAYAVEGGGAGIDVHTDTTARIYFEGEWAGYKSSFGVYKVDPITGEFSSVEMLWENASAVGSGGELIPGVSYVDVDVTAGESLGFFLIPNGFNNNSFGDDVSLEFRDADGSPATIHSDAPELFAVPNDGSPAYALNGPFFHSVATGHLLQLNADDFDHVVFSSDNQGNITTAFEDLWGGGDMSFDDMIFRLEVGQDNVDAQGETLYVPIEPNPDGSFSIDPAQLDDLALMTADGTAGDSRFNVAITTNENGATGTIDFDLDLTAGAVNDQTVLTENAVAGTPVMMLTVDGDAADHVFALVDAGGNPVNDTDFEMVGNQVQVKPGATLDYESVGGHPLFIEVTDPQGDTSIHTVIVRLSDQPELVSLGDGGVVYLEHGVAETEVAGGAGSDVMFGNTGDDNFSGGAGDDLFVMGQGGDDTVAGGQGWTDELYLSGAQDSDQPWTIVVDGQEVDYDLESGGIDLDPDASGYVQMADGTTIDFSEMERISWD